MRIFETTFCGQLIFCLADKSSIRERIIIYCLIIVKILFMGRLFNMFLFCVFFPVCMLFNYIL